jgi:hypothetical protein
MTKCPYCGWKNDYETEICHKCGLHEFEAKLESMVQEQEKSSKSQGTSSLSIVEKSGKTVTLKCRTPREAFLVADELEARDIVAILPDEKTMMTDYELHGFVNVQVSANAYEAAKELQSVLERTHWENRAQEPLPLIMKIAAFLLFPVIGPGWAFLVMKYLAYKRKGYDRKKREFGRWLLFSAVFWFVLVLVLTRF